MPDVSTVTRRRRRKYNRARVRRFIFSVGPNRISGGRLRKKHLARDVVVRELEVASSRWPVALDGLRIGHVSDFHLGELLPLDRALDVIGLLKELAPDLVACTGDVVDLDLIQVEPLLRAMSDITAPLGHFLVLGNHDELLSAGAIRALAAHVGITVLQNELAQVNRNGGRLTVAGVRWARSAADCTKQVERACGDGAHLLLSHNPKAFLRAAELEIPLTLAGHTHGGQVALRNRPNANLALTHRHRAGHFVSGPSHLYVTAGVGAWFPLRINCPPEIALITMRHGAQQTEVVI